jgi:hypothetical protein
MEKLRSRYRRCGFHGARMILKVFPSAMTLCLALGVGWAQWSNDPTVNTPICTAANYQQSPESVSDGSGGAIIAWVDRRSGSDYIYAQRVDAWGYTMWAPDGVAISTAAGGQYDPAIVPDGSGGAIITWRHGTWDDSDIYAQRVDASGAPLWTAGGVAVCNAPGIQSQPAIVSDGSDGAIITWQHGPYGDGDIYVRQVDASGAPLWTAGGVAICTATGHQGWPALVSDGSGGAIITWTDERVGTDYADIYAQRVSASGTPLWTADGVAICDIWDRQGQPAILSDGVGGAIITWVDSRAGWMEYDVYVQLVDALGIPQWTANGVVLSAAEWMAEFPAIVSDGSGGAIIAWEDRRWGQPDIFARRVDASGTPLWAADGVLICAAEGYQQNIAIVSDGGGGAIITWHDYGRGNLYAQKVNASGNTLWAAHGAAVSTTAYGHHDPAIVSDGSGGAILAWQDYRWEYQDSDIYAQRIYSYGSPAWVGDVNCDGDTTMSDALCAFKRFVLGDASWTHADLLECACDFSELAADVNCDAAVTPSDALCIAWRSLKGYWYDPQPGDNCGCEGSPKAVVNEMDWPPVSVRLVPIEGDRGQLVTIEIIAEGGRVLDAFGFRLNYPADLLEFSGVSKTDETETWAALEGFVIEDGGLQVGGYATEALEVSEPTALVQVMFRVRSDVCGTAVLHLVECVDDLHGAELSGVELKVGNVPADYGLEQNYPNPFNPETRITYRLPEAGYVALTIYNVLGQEVARLVDGTREAGSHSVTWDGRDSRGQEVSTGVYMYRMESSHFVQAKRMLLVK